MDDIEKKELGVADSGRERSESDTSDKSEALVARQSSSRSSLAEVKIPKPREEEPQSSLSRYSSTRSDVVKVPRMSRRGLLSRLTIVPEVTVPTNYANSTKWLITTTVAIAAAAAPMGSAIVFPALQDIIKEFHSDATTANLSVALYMLAMSIFPLWWSSFSETLGRRTIYITSFVLFVVFGVLSAVAKNIAMLIVMRMLSGGAAASVQAVGAGTIADIWEPKERGRAMGMFYLGPLCGPMLAPIVGGAMTQALGWRSTMWFLVIFGGVVTLFLILCLPETLKRKVSERSAQSTLRPRLATAGEHKSKDFGIDDHEVLDESEDVLAAPQPPLERMSTRQSVNVKTKRWLVLLKRIFIDPLKIILLLQYPAVFVTVLYASITFGSLYFLNISVETTFAKTPYNFSTLLVGLTYIPASLGYFLASILGGRWLDYIMKREAKNAGRYHPDGSGRLIFRPEDRMRENAWLGCFMFPAALIWYGWTTEFHVHWIVPLIANFFFGCGSMIVFAMATTMLTEFLPGRASMGIAVNNFLRNIFSCVGGIVASPLINAIGNGWMCTALALVSLGCGVPTIWAMKRYGARWRDKMEEEMRDW